jgi:hypothetical protein
MKMFILALDGMDYDLTVKLNLENVLQEQYGRLEVPINKDVRCPSSPEVWASFLCAEHVMIDFEGRKNTLALKILKSLKRLMPFLSFGIGKKISGRVKGFPKLERSTWIDNPNVKEIGVPYYSYTNEAFEYMKEFADTKDLDLHRKRLYELYLTKSRDIMREVRNLPSGNYDVVFAYLHYPDLFNHAWFTRKDELEEFYFEIDEYVSELKSVLENTHFLIISDHGFDFTKNEHSNFGFISSNKKMIFPRSIIELGKQIKTISEEKMK